MPEFEPKQLVTDGAKLMRVICEAANGVWTWWTDSTGKRCEGVYFVHALTPVHFTQSKER